MAELDTSGGGHKKGPGVKKQVKKEGENANKS